MNGPDNILITGAPAKIAAELMADRLLIRVWKAPEYIDALHNHSGRAIPALQCMTLSESLLQRMKI